MRKLAVVAFGGNALLRGNQQGTIDEQEANVYQTCENLIGLFKQDYNIVIGHGNGPQVGNVLLQHEAGFTNYGIPKMPIDFCVAETQGSIGYMIEQQLQNVFFKNNIERNIIAMITQVIIDKNDKAFKEPTKPVGPFYSKDEAEKLSKENKWVFSEDPRKRGWRRIVASPVPLKINNWNVVEKLAREGTVVITVGGGGIPAYIREDNFIVGIDAVIDKDLASAVLATNIKADEFFILTDVPNVCINFRKKDEIKLSEVSLEEAKKYLEEGHFTEGSMAPKIRAAIHFLENGGKQTKICEANSLAKQGAGTIIYKVY
ncbi:MAG: carbamate kinase [Bacteroidales bacterium]|nr:carbamate kinase [Bacteroidales bacterium]